MEFYWKEGALCARPEIDEEYRLLAQISNILESFPNLFNGVPPNPMVSTGVGGSDDKPIST